MKLDDEAQLMDPAFYAGDPHPTFARLRADRPVFWFEAGQFWAVARYDDVRRVGSDQDNFSSTRGTLIADGLRRIPVDRLVAPNGSRHLIRSDSPEHTAMRRILQRSFTPAAVRRLSATVEQCVDDAIAGIEPGVVTNAVDAVSAPVTTYVMAQLLGIPRDRWRDFRRWTDSAIEQMDVKDPIDIDRVARDIGELIDEFRDICDDRRLHPEKDDLVAQLICGDVDGEKLSQDDLDTYCKLLLSAGSETTRNLVTGLLQQLHAHADQRSALIASPGDWPKAVEEGLRYVSPINAFGRTAKNDLVIRDQPIKRGDFVVMLYPSANRDESVWSEPNRFDVFRSEDAPNVAFGYGPHFCLGANIARLEAKVIIETVCARFPDYEVVGPLTRKGSTLVGIMSDLPTVFA